MAINLIESVKSFFTPEVVDRASIRLGESIDGVHKALAGGIPAVFAGLINRSESGQSGGLLSDAREAAIHPVVEGPGALFAGGSTVQPLKGGWASALFGGKIDFLTNALASFAGIKNGSANTLLNLLTPLSLGVLGQHALDNNLDAGGLGSFLSSQKSFILAALPGGLSLSHLFDGGAEAALPAGETYARRIGSVAPAARPKANWLWPLLLGLAVLALIVYLVGRGRNREERIVTPATTTTQQPAVKTGIPAVTLGARELLELRLPNNTVINAYRGGVEEQLVNCLNNAACIAGRDRWFDFDNINFETGSARLTAASQAQVNNLVAILKAYPKAKVKIGGYTDKVGNEAANQRLSQARANAVTNAIKAGGVPAAQLLAPEGYGSAFAKVPATASDEARKADRRIAVQLREKG